MVEIKKHAAYELLVDDTSLFGFAREEVVQMIRLVGFEWAELWRAGHGVSIDVESFEEF